MDRKPVPYSIASQIKLNAVSFYDVEGDDQDAFDVRHWGSYEVLDTDTFNIEDGGWAYCDKIIMLKPGAKLSVQKHFFRRENWTVYKGEIVVSHGPSPDEIQETTVSAYGSVREIHLPENGIHFVENRSKKTAHFFERQYGPLLFELDNVRFPTLISYTAKGRIVKGDNRRTDFGGVDEAITIFCRKGFHELLDGYWSKAYVDFDPSASELHEPRTPKGNIPCLGVGGPLLLTAV